MTEQDVLDLINLWIVANGNNEITADVLRPILQEMVQQPNDLIGDLSTLNTADQSNLVSAINEIYNSLSNTGIELHEGLDDPNDTPPATYNIADFYIQKDISNNPIQLWQYNGVEWLNTSDHAPTTLEDARQNGDTIDGIIDVSLQIENKQSTNLAQVVDVTGKTVSFSDYDTLTANFPVNYFENDSVDIETFTLPVIIGNEDKFIYFVNKSDELCTLTSDGINEIWYREELLSIQIHPKGSIILKNNGSYWVVLSLFKGLEEDNYIPLSGTEVGKPITGLIETESNIALASTQTDMRIGVADKLDFDDISRGAIIEFNSQSDKSTMALFASNSGGPSLTFSSYDDGTAEMLISSSDINFKGIIGDAFYNKLNDPNAFAQIGDIDNKFNSLLAPQIEVSGNHTVDASWNGKEVTFTGSGTLTIPNTLSDQFNFTLYAETGVTIAWAIASPYTWRVAGLTVGTAPPSMTAGQFCQVSRRIGTNEIKVLGL